MISADELVEKLWKMLPADQPNSTEEALELARSELEARDRLRRELVDALRALIGWGDLAQHLDSGLAESIKRDPPWAHARALASPAEPRPWSAKGEEGREAESKHTPGPWTILEGSIAWDDQAGETRVTIEGGRDRFHLRLPTVGVRPEADARLIAAAPEMLDALRECATHLSDFGCFRIVERAVATIAKATGEEVKP